jgi:hypothetical protein
MAGSITIGCGLGILTRINYFFPEIKPPNILNQPNLSDLVSNPQTIPVDSQPICLRGQLLGRRGLRNTFAQDLILQTPSGIIKLHYLPEKTPLTNFLPRIRLFGKAEDNYTVISLYGDSLMDLEAMSSHKIVGTDFNGDYVGVGENVVFVLGDDVYKWHYL